MREQAGLNIGEAAARLDMSRYSLLRVESGAYRANVHLIRSMMDLYDCYVDDLVDQARNALKPRWYQQYSKPSPSLPNLGYVEVEDGAVQVREFSALCVPGLLQTEPYVRALFRAYSLPRSAKKFEDDVAVRLIRQRRLTAANDPLELQAVVDEAALRRRVGGADVMSAQLEHMIKAAELPTVTLQVLPLRDGAHSAMGGGFVMLSFPDEDDPDLLFVSYGFGAMHIESADQLRMAHLVFDQVCSQALSPADSVALIERVRVGIDDE